MFPICLYFLLFISIFLHELGHYITSKVFRVPIYIFSIGNGPLVFSINFLETHFQLRLFPLSGYIYNDEYSFNKLLLLKKYIIILSGVLTNGLLFLISLALILKFDTNSLKYYILSINHSIYNVFINFTLENIHLAEQNLSYLFYSSKNIDILTLFMFINVILSISNLLPIPPFDGSEVWLCTIEELFLGFNFNKPYGNKQRF